VRLPHGFLGTRADVLMDVILLVMLAVPFVLVWSIRLAKNGRYVLHRGVQSGLLAALLAAVVAFEADVRLSGGSAAFLTGSPYLGTALLRGILGVHIAVAVTTFLAWTVVVVNIWRRGFGATPQVVGPSHRRTGYLIFAGVTFTSVSGAVLYYMGFAA